jgi:glycosyltransferase involved in cell wall biosynthesis
VARLVPENNIELFLDACELLPPDRQVVIVGSAMGWPEIEERIRGLAARRPVLWLGHVSDQRLLAALWKHCAVYFHGHSVGGTNPALLQAMGHGAPVVAVDTVFNREVLGGAGVVVGSDAAAVAESICSVVSTPESASDARRNEISRVEAAYTWEAVCSSYQQVLRDSSVTRRDGRGR